MILAVWKGYIIHLNVLLISLKASVILKSSKCWSYIPLYASIQYGLWRETFHLIKQKRIKEMAQKLSGLSNKNKLQKKFQINKGLPIASVFSTFRRVKLYLVSLFTLIFSRIFKCVHHIYVLKFSHKLYFYTCKNFRI